MKLHPRVTKTAVELVKRFEGLRRRAARLPDGSWTVGYGHTKSAREGAEVSPDDAEALLYYDLSEVATKVEAWTFTPLNQNQFDALIAFAFNIGVENFRRSTVLKRVNEGQHLPAAAAMELWRKSELDGEGLVVDALVRRRAAEKALYLTPPEGFRPSPSQVLRPTFDFSVIEAAAQSHLASRAAVIDAPMEGDEAIAMVESPPAISHAETPASPARDAVDQVSHKLQGVLADTPPANEPHAEPAPSAVNDAIAPVAGLALAAGAAAAPLAFHGFEAPPARYPQPTEGAPPAPANEHGSEPAAAAEPASADLFEQPLTPAEGVKPADPAVVEPPLVAALHPAQVIHAPAKRENRNLLWSVLGLLGVLLFVAAIVSMLRGSANGTNLLLGFVGVALITPAGIHFLFHWMSRSAPR